MSGICSTHRERVEGCALCAFLEPVGPPQRTAYERELEVQLAALRRKNEMQAHELKYVYEASERRNRQLRALRMVYCTGGCRPLANGDDVPDVTEADVFAVEEHARRLRKWFVNRLCRKEGR